MQLKHSRSVPGSFGVGRVKPKRIGRLGIYFCRRLVPGALLDLCRTENKRIFEFGKSVGFQILEKEEGIRVRGEGAPLYLYPLASSALGDTWRKVLAESLGCRGLGFLHQIIGHKHRPRVKPMSSQMANTTHAG